MDREIDSVVQQSLLKPLRESPLAVESRAEVLSIGLVALRADHDRLGSYVRLYGEESVHDLLRLGQCEGAPAGTDPEGRVHPEPPWRPETISRISSLRRPSGRA